MMMLLEDRLCPEGFGECGVMGRCATCLIKATGITGYSAIKERNEPVALSRRHYDDPTYRLSCQLYLSADLEGVVIEVVENQ